jgi:hypothetical protein
MLRTGFECRIWSNWLSADHVLSLFFKMMSKNGQSMPSSQFVLLQVADGFLQASYSSLATFISYA